MACFLSAEVRLHLVIFLNLAHELRQSCPDTHTAKRPKTQKWGCYYIQHILHNVLTQFFSILMQVAVGLRKVARFFFLSSEALKRQHSHTFVCLLSSLIIIQSRTS